MSDNKNTNLTKKLETENKEKEEISKKQKISKALRDNLKRRKKKAT